MSNSLLETFPALEKLDHFRHGFVLRHPAIPVDTDREATIERLRPHYDAVLSSELGTKTERLWFGEQVHSDGIATCPGKKPPESQLYPKTDGLITATPGQMLGIFVADCCAVFLVDPVNRACGLVHSGKNGSALGIASSAIRKMAGEFGTNPVDVTVQLSPCIRPPAYEIDIAARIRMSCCEAGVPDNQIHDTGTCTSRDLSRYYSYRAEKGKTGRMLAVAGWAL